MMDCNGSTQQLQLNPGRAIQERVDDGAIGSEDGTSKLWERVEADERRLGSEECLKLWMEMEARCGSDGRITEPIKQVCDRMVVPSEPKYDDRPAEAANGEKTPNEGEINTRLEGGAVVVEETSIGDRQGSINREKEEWSPPEVIRLLEAYEERLGDGRVGNLRGKEWEDVALTVNRDLDGKGGSNKSLKQCKRKVYALRRWYKTIVSKQVTFREDGYEHTLLGIMGRIMAPAGPYRAGIPSGIGASEQVSPMPSKPSLLDEDDEEAELIKATRAGILPKLGGGFVDAMLSSMQLGRTTGKGGDNDKKRKAERNYSAATIDSNSCENVNLSKKRCGSSCGANSQSGEVVGALNIFAKVLVQVEQTKMEIMKDLDRRRTELQIKLAKLDPYQQDQSDSSQTSAMLTLL